MRMVLMLILWCLLLVLCWPLALLVLIALPIVWLMALALRVVGIVIEAALALLKAILMLPARLLAWPGTQRQLA